MCQALRQQSHMSTRPHPLCKGEETRGSGRLCVGRIYFLIRNIGTSCASLASPDQSPGSHLQAQPLVPSSKADLVLRQKGFKLNQFVPDGFYQAFPC